MNNDEINDRYYDILKGYVSTREEKYLMRSEDLGYELVRLNVPPEDIIEMHELAVKKLAADLPAKSVMESVGFLSTPLVELMMAYGLAFRQWIEDLEKNKKELEVYAQELQHSNELKELFADIMRHDLLNPASLINGFVAVLLEWEADDKKKSLLSNIDKSNRNLISIIEKAAEFAKLDSVEEIDFSIHDLGSTLENIVDNFRPRFEENEMTVDVQINSFYPSMVNSVIDQVFINLISNAIKYSPKGSHVEVTISDIGEQWQVNIIDHGSGIPEEDRELIFTRFSRLDKVKKGCIKGTGLGLAIVHKIVTLHNGEVGVDSNYPEDGSTFWVRLNKVHTD
ncbi:ATP-binding protein [Methanolobus sediminis]|uniref:histidine kinase n=1 Tax=Methanolobus sediminis TaxID=3072978 RepID=A0AA51YML3_9EURY|nr:ATP-binding protein [Methanolobus sediminis]WMW26144.1 ATP-binding protein [Methanolobus sediminis]